MLLTRYAPWNPAAWRQFNQLQSEVNRIFERFDHSRQEPAAFPPLNLWEEGDGYRLEAELPGLNLADIEVTITAPNQVTLKGERQALPNSEATPHRQERVFGSFVRTVTLPAEIDADNVDARLDQGVLTLVLPKHQLAKPRKIKIKA
ncbi:MAG: Hsp20/alpha crystallin family protein [Planctomycetota bacterium]